MRAVIPTIIVQALKNRRVRLGNVHPLRDLTFVHDTVDAFIKMAESGKTVGKQINFGSGSEISILDLAKMIVEIIKEQERIVDIPIEIDESRIRPENSEVQRLLASNKLAKELLDWEPRHTLKEGLIKTINYIKSRLDNYKHEVYHI
tara:strand:- start:461 stop:901 length:441 start_codon:yes stop_codon:yes gene_type:complete